MLEGINSIAMHCCCSAQSGIAAAFQGIAQELFGLSQQVFHLHKNMLQHFLILAKKLGLHHSLMIEQFDQVYHHMGMNQILTAEIKALQQTLQENLTSFDRRLQTTTLNLLQNLTPAKFVHLLRRSEEVKQTIRRINNNA